MKNLLLFMALLATASTQAQTETYAEKLGFPKGKKVVILHVDDAGMSYESNQGTIKSMEQGIASSTSVMMPCGWVPQYMNHIKQRPNTDAGIHLTLTSEWATYRWQPLVGCKNAPGLCDEQGSLWRSVAQVAQHASPDEVEAEMRAQIARFRGFGMQPTHLDSHMGTVLVIPKFLERYIKVATEEKIPALWPGGHATLIMAETKGTAITPAQAQQLGKILWNAGLPVLDDMHSDSYGWKLPAGTPVTDDNLRQLKTDKFIEVLKACQPGLTYIIMHCTDTTPQFDQISDSGPTRRGDLLAMLDPRLKQFIEKEGIIVTTWRELINRRANLK